MGFPADRAGGARKKFFSPNPVEFWLDAWWKDARKFWQPDRVPKRNQYWQECSMGFPADRAGGARKKFFSPNSVEFWLDAWCLPCLQDAMENGTLKLMFVYPLSALPTKLHGEHCAQAYDCFPFVLLCEFGLSLLTCATPV